MSALETGLRELIAELVRDEVRRALAAAMRPEEYLTTARAAQVAQVTPGTIRRWIRQGRLSAHRAGRSCRVTRADLDRLLLGGSGGKQGLSPEAMAARDFGGRAGR